jgi:hypothetical protein
LAQFLRNLSVIAESGFSFVQTTSGAWHGYNAARGRWCFDPDRGG